MCYINRTQIPPVDIHSYLAMSFSFGTTATVILLAGLSAVSAAPSKEIVRRQSIGTLSSSQVDAFTPYSYYASAGYCAPAATLAWNCGSGFTVVA